MSIKIKGTKGGSVELVDEDISVATNFDRSKDTIIDIRNLGALKSPDGNRWKLEVSNAGVLTAVKI